ncbi:protein tyrosine phosphatase-like protein, putative, partial [Hepatocystis sp. ex Piliocolobus tephrosceles]
MSLKNKFIFAYNAISCSMWIAVLVVSLKYVCYKEKYPVQTFWLNYKNLITITQSLAIFDIVLALF